MADNQFKLTNILLPDRSFKIKKTNGIPNFLNKFDINKQLQEDIWSKKTYKVNPRNHVFTTIQEHFGNRLIKSIGLKDNSIVVDIGCFIGEKLWQLKEKKIVGIGVDIAIPSLVAAKEIDTYGYQYIAADLELLPFKNNSIDMVMVFDVIEHLSNADKGFKEISRVLYDNGLFLLHIPIKDNMWSMFWWKQKLFPGAAQKDYDDVGHAIDRMLTTTQIENYLSKYNFSLQKKIYYNSFFVHFWDREFTRITAWLFVNIFNKGNSISDRKRSVHSGKVGRFRNLYGKYVIPILEILSFPDLILSKLHVGNTCFFIAKKL